MLFSCGIYAILILLHPIIHGTIGVCCGKITQYFGSLFTEEGTQ